MVSRTLNKQTYIEYLRKDVSSVNHHGTLRMINIAPAANARDSKNGGGGGKVGPKNGRSDKQQVESAGGDETVTNRRAYAAARWVATWGLPSYFLVFTVVYFAVGAIFYSKDRV